MVGNAAVIGFSPPGGGTFPQILVIDNGPTGDVFAAAFGTGPDDCPAPADFVASIGPSGLTSGDYVVIDDEPRPTSKDQCTHGGWRRFPVFKNQGTCVSFVATEGRSPPAGP